MPPPHPLSPVQRPWKPHPKPVRSRRQVGRARDGRSRALQSARGRAGLPSAVSLLLTVVVCRLACDCCYPAIQPMSYRPIGHGSVSRSAIAELPTACWWCCAGDVGFGRAAARRAGVGWDAHSPAPCSTWPASDLPDLAQI